jgi:hypothetical protein
MQRKICLNMHSREEARQLFWSRFSNHCPGEETIPSHLACGHKRRDQTPWRHLTIAAGGFLPLEWRHDPRWPHRGKGLLALLHLGLCALIHWAPALTAPLLWMMLISGSIGSHMPRKFRHWSILQGWEFRNR